MRWIADTENHGFLVHVSARKGTNPADLQRKISEAFAWDPDTDDVDVTHMGRIDQYNDKDGEDANED